VPSPCVTNAEQFFPFAFSSRAYIQCDGELIYFQPCGPLLYWNQEEKFCDRKRPNNVDSKIGLTKPKATRKPTNRVQFDIVDEDDEESAMITTTTSTTVPTTITTTASTETEPTTVEPQR
jgi:hypothetical protein